MMTRSFFLFFLSRYLDNPSESVTAPQNYMILKKKKQKILISKKNWCEWRAILLTFFKRLNQKEQIKASFSSQRLMQIKVLKKKENPFRVKENPTPIAVGRRCGEPKGRYPQKFPFFF